MSDHIDRQAAIDALNEYFVRIGKLKRRGLTQGEKAISLDTVGAIKTLPSAEPVRHGKWIKADSQQYFRKHYPFFTCSECGQRKDSQKTWNYCPNCGARMDTK